jgi:pyochelin synthetase
MSTCNYGIDREAIERLLADLESLGVRLWEEAGQLHFRAPKGVLNEERRKVLRDSKEAILSYLRTGPGATLTPQPEARYEAFPLTQVQGAYLLGRRDAFAYGGIGCHAYGEIRLRQPDPDALQAAWQTLVQRHDMLRAVIDIDGSQRVLPDPPPYVIAVTDLRQANSDAVLAHIDSIRRQLDHRVYAPNEWPLFDLRLTLDNEHAVLHLSLDFLIADYVSIRVLLDELNRLYREPHRALPPLSVTFRDYQLAERRLRAGSRYERDREYWWKRIDTLPGAPELPVQEASASSGAVRFHRWTMRLDSSEWKGLRERASAHGVTASCALLAAYAEVISRWSRHPRFALDITLLQRLPLHPEVNRLVGDFTSVSLLSVDAACAPRFDMRAKVLQAQLWEDIDHRLCSGIEVMREIARRRGVGAAMMPVIFTSAIGLNGEAPGDGSRLGEFLYGISQTPQAWIDCQAMEQGDGLEVNWDVREGVFPEGVIDDMFAAFEDLTRRINADEQAWLSESPAGLPEAQRLRRCTVNDTSEPNAPALLHERIIEQALRRPDRIAVISSKEQLSYGELLSRALAVARALRERGCGPGDVVAIVMDVAPAQVVSVLGVLLCGAAYLPIESKHPAQRRDRMLEDARVRHALTQSWVATRDALPGWVARIDVDALTAAEQIGSPLVPAADSNDIAYVIYTSGSTGAPKGVMVTHRSAANTIDDINRRFHVTGDDSIFGISNLSFDLSVYDIFGPLSVGGRLVLPDDDKRRYPSHWAQMIEAGGVTIWNSVPAKMQMLWDYMESQGGVAASSLRLVLLSGDWISTLLARHLRERLPGVELVSLGGATEASIWSIYYPIVEVRPDLPRIPYGRPLANQTFHVLDELLRPCPDWTVGELYIGGAGLAAGYFGDESKTSQRFIHHPQTGERLYRTGDFGRYLPDGNIEFLGREDFQVKIRGHRIELAEIEAALESQPAVGAAAAMVCGDEPQEKRLAAFVESKSRARRKDSRELAVSLAETGETAAAGLREGVDCDRVVRFARQLDDTALLSMLHALRQQGLFSGAEDGHTLDEIVNQAKVLPRHHRLVRRWLNALQLNGMLRRAPATGRYHAARAVNGADVEEAWLRAEALQPDVDRRTELMDYFRLAGRRLPELLRGELDPVQLLFPEGRVEIHEVAYQDSFLSRYLNRIVTAAIQQIAAWRGGGKLRVLEVGAGVGGTSLGLIPGLADFDTEYLFTDVSQFFLNNASERFGEYPWVRYGLFDINQDYRRQGLSSNSFDTILCANVLHYAQDASAVLDGIRELLRPEGWLVFIEMVRDNYQVLTSMEFLFDETFADFHDVRHGQDATFIGLDQWHDLLRKAGADSIFYLPRPDDVLSRIGFHVFAAQFKSDREPLESRELMAHLSDLLPDYMLPSQIEVVDKIPLNENGKVDRKTLRAWLPSKKDRLVVLPGQDGGTDLERRLASVWAAVLNVPHVGLNQDFFELGGDSLVAAQLVGRMREQVPEAKDLFFDNLLRLMLDGPTVRKVATSLEEARSAHTRTDRPRQTSPLIRLLGACGQPVHVLVHDSSGTLASYSELLRDLAGEQSIAGLVVNDPEMYVKFPPEVVFERTAADYARALGEQNPYIHLVGYEMGGVLATEVARCLLESGADVALTLISSAPPWFVVEDDLAAEYFFARGAGIDPMRLGYPSESAMARALETVLAESPNRIRDDSFARLDGDSELAGVGWCFRRLAQRSREDRLSAIAQRLSPADSEPFGASQVGALFDVYLQTITGAAQLQVAPYAGNMTVLRPSTPAVLWPTLQDRATVFWLDRCLGEVEIIDVPGDHFTCLKSPHGGRIAELLKSAKRGKVTRA